ncbi:uncharacterized protein BT62DRAFT_999038 [Guyanagaster necrorhizus]|uniref:Uncharacterized protein n=1 Tax=Guyanagaster necrorhizus TaxID=856835 RepID=A0A9P7W5E9_9AGAR|nr:uncharacterized protein BT62DRAFT_999038 [Guyanagaster necrorhizus MCA 3950]KAG7452998.1 hypothetical protein BT62DRAFT_999038 [Guyanagaster necrorhizus MCA 3950]
MFSVRALLLVVTVTLFAMLVMASPIPDETIAKKSLKQLVMKRGEGPTPVRRADEHKPSGWARAEVGKRL